MIPNGTVRCRKWKVKTSIFESQTCNGIAGDMQTRIERKWQATPSTQARKSMSRAIGGKCESKTSITENEETSTSGKVLNHEAKCVTKSHQGRHARTVASSG